MYDVVRWMGELMFRSGPGQSALFLHIRCLASLIAPYALRKQHKTTIVDKMSKVKLHTIDILL